MVWVKSTVIMLLFLFVIQAQSVESDTSYQCKQDSITVIDSLKKLVKNLKGPYAQFRSKRTRYLSGRLGINVTVDTNGSVNFVDIDSALIKLVLTEVNTWSVSPFSGRCSAVNIFLPLTFAGFGEVVGARLIGLEVIENKNPSNYQVAKYRKSFKHIHEFIDSVYLHRVTFQKSFSGFLTLDFIVSSKGKIDSIVTINNTISQPDFKQTILEKFKSIGFFYLINKRAIITFYFDDLRGNFAVILKNKYEHNPFLNSNNMHYYTPTFKPNIPNF